MISRDEAIRRIDASRASHVSWVTWYRLHPDDQATLSYAGDLQFHENQILIYDGVLEFLRSLPE